MDDGILERLGVCFGEAGLGGLDGGDAALEDVGRTVDAVLLAHGIRAALISILLAVRDALRNTDGDGLDGLNALGGGDGHGAANADGQALRALFLALEGQNIAEASDITEALAKGACLVVEGGGFILALRGEEDAGELAVAAGILTGQALAAGVAVGVCTVDGDDAYEVDAVGEHVAEKREGSFLEVIDGFILGGFLAHFCF